MWTPPTSMGLVVDDHLLTCVVFHLGDTGILYKVYTQFRILKLIMIQKYLKNSYDLLSEDGKGVLGETNVDVPKIMWTTQIFESTQRLISKC